MLLLGYFVAASLVLVALTAMILAISRAVGDCPQSGARARAAGITLATGYLALGGGAVLLVGAGATLSVALETVFFCLGLICIVLGLGFTQAVTMLRTVVDGAAKPRPAPAPEAATTPMEPVLA